MFEATLPERTPFRRRPLWPIYGHGQPPGQLIDTLSGLGVGPLDVAVETCVAHYAYLVANVVKYQEGGGQHEHRFR